MFNSLTRPRSAPLSRLALVCTILVPAAAWAQTTISTVAGNGAATFSGDGAAAASASLNHPRALAIDSAGNLYIADVDNYRIRKVTPTGVITTVAGSGTLGAAGDGGAATAATFSDLNGVAVDGGGNVYIADSGNRRIRKVTLDGNVSTVAGTGTQGFAGDGGLATAGLLNRPSSIVVDSGGNLYFSDSSNQRIRRVSADGTITTIAGSGVEGFSGDGGQATAATMSFPLGLFRDLAGNIYFTDGNNNRVRKISVSGIITTVAGDGRGRYAGDNGLATAASLNIPHDVALDFAGNIYIADAGNNRVRKVDTAGIITTVSGTGTDGFSGDGGVGTSAMMSFPWGLATDPSGNVYISDRVNNRVRKLTGPAQGPPSLPAGSTVNSASFRAGFAVAPGGIVTIFGSNLASAAASAQAIPLPAAIGDTSVTFNGIAAPLYYVSPTQINAQVPFNLGSGSVNIQVSRGTATPATSTVTVGAVSPGIFIVDQNTSQGAITHAVDATLVTATSPARAGENIVVYCTGLGAVKVAVKSGDGAPSTAPLAETTVTPTVTFGTTPAAVTFSGLTPGLVGLYQVNLVVPSGLAAGNQTVQITTGGVASNSATVAVR